MDKFNPVICREGIDYARTIAFATETSIEADPYARLSEVYWTIMRALRYGNVIRYENEHGMIVGMCCYTVGTIDAEFEDRHVVHVMYGLLAQSLQGSVYFMKGMHFLAHTIRSLHPEVELLQIEAYDTAKRNNRLYSKFARITGHIQSGQHVRNVYTTTVTQFSDYVEYLIENKKQ
jgi:hypothetical protein